MTNFENNLTKEQAFHEELRAVSPTTNVGYTQNSTVIKPDAETLIKV